MTLYSRLMVLDISISDAIFDVLSFLMLLGFLFQEVVDDPLFQMVLDFLFPGGT